MCIEVMPVPAAKQMSLSVSGRMLIGAPLSGALLRIMNKAEVGENDVWIAPVT